MPLESRVVEDASPALGVLVDALADEVCGCRFGMPEAAADEDGTGLEVDVVAGIGTFPACAGPGAVRGDV